MVDAGSHSYPMKNLGEAVRVYHIITLSLLYIFRFRMGRKILDKPDRHTKLSRPIDING
jgi:hypothetical protein